MIIRRNLEKFYAHGVSKTFVLRQISLEVKEGEFLSIVCDALDRFRIVGKKDLYPSHIEGAEAPVPQGTTTEHTGSMRRLEGMAQRRPCRDRAVAECTWTSATSSGPHPPPTSSPTAPDSLPRPRPCLPA